MKRILIACISAFNIEKSMEREYIAGDITVTAKQTNEAIFKYLLEKLGGIETFIGVCTEKAKETFEGYLKEEFNNNAESKKTQFEYIGMENKPDYNKTLSEIAKKVVKASKKDDVEIYIDMAGGPRDFVIFVQLLAKLLSFLGFTVHTYYADITSNPNKIVDVDDVFTHMELLDAVNEFANHGSVKLLKNKFSENETAKPLLDSLDAISNSIQLCSVNLVDTFKSLKDNLDMFERTRDNNDELFVIRTMLPLIKKKFYLEKSGDEISVLDIIRWCLESGLVQQALTIYNEYVCKLIVDKKILAFDPAFYESNKNDIRDNAKKHHISTEEAEFYLALDKIGENMNDVEFTNEKTIAENVLEAVAVESKYVLISYHMKKCHIPNEVKLNIETDPFKEILMDIRYVRNVRNHINHASEQGNDYDVYFKKYEFPTHTDVKPDYTPEKIIEGVTRAIEHIEGAIVKVGRRGLL